ncbi:F-type H+-transporting ATPase subunit gamma [Kerstersia gyiorum]|jgi:F-type H+-transporting ATPase subunit gamma|uniref:ATP synthase gamma chain n=1 Tax=Kerstersia gyiorum TaxID=206506 RepID=A0A4Q7MJQ0_9BURK|nr:F0F1 ATP synthase subunit gamma [Kerstersia gyiorum]AZV92537.1 F0F1 ATP synthase subunit gamma [Bordetella sp. J329]KAB0542461.1 F0F1 ATP synthase subunit gamma [Kerstersia gyiorum]MCH4272674.1 F0F1 ATP synthase subunit gamma [Kerstersia gyiorum]MCI1230432.1 F0F1 ATP synthase subunit gamma [Kerstersia gyiorum]QBR39464.1 F0F1 ATP synthase subunit gamma [Kerstersia gyiorum]
MPGIKEIRTKIKSVQNTRKITKAMEMVAASKMRKAQERMRAGRPYADKVREIASHLMQANPEYSHPYLHERESVKAVGVVVITTDKGLCGGLNTNVMRLVLNRLREFETAGVKTQFTAFGNKGLGLLTRLDVNLVSQEVQLGDAPNLERLVGALKVQFDDFIAGRIDAVYVATNRFVNTMRQEPVFERLLPLPGQLVDPYQTRGEAAAESDTGVTKGQYGWDYIYEPDAKSVIDDLLHRYVEGLVYQAVAENMASEQSARMVAMKAASDNAKKVIGDLQLVYNKTRQAAITKEISEIVGGAAAV